MKKKSNQKTSRSKVNQHANFKHGDAGTRLYNRWAAMRARCNRKTDKNYHSYGGRGIKVCKEWDNYSVFKKWAMENGFAPDLSIERIDVNGNYEPSNCTWITMLAQAKNRRTNYVITFNGKTQNLADWSKETGIHYYTMLNRLRNGWSIERMLTEVAFVGKNQNTGTYSSEEERHEAKIKYMREWRIRQKEKLTH